MRIGLNIVRATLRIVRTAPRLARVVRDAPRVPNQRCTGPPLRNLRVLRAGR